MNEAQSDLKHVFRHGKTVAFCLITLLVFLYTASGLFSVKPEQRGVVTRFGRVIYDNVPPGIHYHWPWPVESVARPRTTEIRSMAVAYGAETAAQTTNGDSLQAKQTPSYAVKPLPADDQGDMSLQELKPTAPLLTGDENLVIATLLIQYTVSEPKAYLYETADADGLLKRITQHETIGMAAGMSVDEVLTTGRFQIQSRLKKGIQATADTYRLGIQIVSVQIQSIQPPREVAEAFRDVASAREDKHKLVQRARGERNRRTPKARGQAGLIVSEAVAYAQEVVEMAHGDAQRFLAAWEEYRKAKTITAHRLYHEAIEEILPRAEKAIFNPEAERLPMLPPPEVIKEPEPPG
jgi:membrane protease subunit HflK